MMSNVYHITGKPNELYYTAPLYIRKTYRTILLSTSSVPAILDYGKRSFIYGNSDVLRSVIL
jgi:hypothetical protein